MAGGRRWIVWVERRREAYSEVGMNSCMEDCRPLVYTIEDNEGHGGVQSLYHCDDLMDDRTACGIGLSSFQSLDRIPC